MAGLTLADAEAKLAGWLAADAQLQTGQEVWFDKRKLTRADAEQVRNNIDYWSKKCQELDAATNGRGRSCNVSPNW
jgi:hypothetical protein